MDGTRAALATARRLLAAALVVVAAGVALAAATPLAPADGVRGLAVRVLPLLVPVAGLLEVAAAGFAVTSLMRARGTDALVAVRRPALVVLTVALALVVLIPVEVFAAILLASMVDTAAT